MARLFSEFAQVRPAAVLMTILDEIPVPVALIEATSGAVRVVDANRAALAVLEGAAEAPDVWPTLDAVVGTLRARVVELPPAANGQRRALLVGSNSPEAQLSTFSSRWRLTRRQCDVLTLLVKGMSNKAIARELGIAEGTVELHMTALLQKLGVDSRATLIAAFWTPV